MPVVREVLMETKRIGAILRVTAVDADTGTEVVFQAPASTSQQALRQLSVSKLLYVMKKEEGHI